MDLLLIIVSAALVNNFVLIQFLGLCPFLGVSGSVESAAGMAVATAFVLTLSSVASYLLSQWVLEPLGLNYLSTVAFIVVIAALVQLTELVLRHSAPLLHRVLGIYLPLITSNCAVLGVALLNLREQHDLVESAVYGFGAALGFGAVLVALAAARERLALADVPESFRGAPIGLITAGLMALAFMGFTGFAKL
ncbi:electron transport complex subunit RsxA [Wenzhouxiangella marina]|uniref:Ion-translocating oxidoreductase complex subunit A n=1 Tax=Wenzhouxiangella marina TaxID=1579979 RepID=A0A0K0XVD3_9GAMM|nr:electron transport complex subunit RsxA [Wenzhouxiangella marina]AKS41669.1 electron transport complex RsxE subunit [Wenzhouxiangella marina]MBB6086570.1 electron transport complex protein RnfA [Wenzhouxiangella marina]